MTDRRTKSPTCDNDACPVDGPNGLEHRVTVLETASATSTTWIRLGTPIAIVVVGAIFTAIQFIMHYGGPK